MPHGDITHIDIPVTDMDRAKAFYGDLFGWKIAEVPGDEGYPMWQAPNEISGGGLAPRDEGFSQPRSYVEVDSIDEAVARATAGGGKVLREKEPHQRDELVGRASDPDGNHIGLYEGHFEAPEGQTRYDSVRAASPEPRLSRAARRRPTSVGVRHPR